MSKSFRHWTPRYIVNRIAERIDHNLNPNNPWLTKQSVGLLDQLLRADDTAIEFGSGRSTLWIAKRVKRLYSVEENAEWLEIVRKKLEAAKVDNVEQLYCPREVSEEDGDKAAYVRSLDRIPDGSLGFCLVDGAYRGKCAVTAIPKMKSGGLLVVDNSNWFLPSHSLTPGARSMSAGTMNADWDRFVAETASWRRIWTDNGVSTTTLFFKP